MLEKIEQEIRVITNKIRQVEMYDLWDVVDVNDLEARLRKLRSQLEAMKI